MNKNIRIAVILVCACATPLKQRVWKTRATGEEISFPSGQKIFFADKNTLFALGEGISADGLKIPLHKEASAKENARIHAEKLSKELCNATHSFYGLAGCCSIAINIPLEEREKKKHPYRGKIIAAECISDSLHPDKIKCTIVTKLQRDRLQQICEENRSSAH